MTADLRIEKQGGPNDGFEARRVKIKTDAGETQFVWELNTHPGEQFKMGFVPLGFEHPEIVIP